MSQFAAQPTTSVMPEELLYGVDGAVATITRCECPLQEELS